MAAGNLIVAILAVAIVGCENTGGRLDVSGHVALDSEPLPNGHITFQPTGPGPTAGSTISNGNYRIKGLVPGEYRVSIKALRPTGKTYTDSDTGQVEQELEQFIPEKYNSRSKLIVEVTVDGPRSFRFDLTSGG